MGPTRGDLRPCLNAAGHVSLVRRVKPWQRVEDDMLVQDLMTREPETTTGETHIKAVVDLMARVKVSSLPVVDPRGRIRGVVTEVDLIRDSITPDSRAHLLPHAWGSTPAVLVSEVMSSPAVTVRPNEDVAVVVRLMTRARLKSLPVVDADGGVVGIISRSDVIRMRARSDQAVAEDVGALFEELEHRDWCVDVHEGIVQVMGPNGASDRSIAEAAAGTVPGVLGVEVREP